MLQLTIHRRSARPGLQLRMLIQFEWPNIISFYVSDWRDLSTNHARFKAKL